MEMVEGASLQDHFTSLVEKRETMEEARIWKIFVQICVALRYIHKDKVISRPNYDLLLSKLVTPFNPLEPILLRKLFIAT